jgi:hypothetical protein
VNARNATTDARCEASVNKVMVTIRHNVEERGSVLRG